MPTIRPYDKPTTSISKDEGWGVPETQGQVMIGENQNQSLVQHQHGLPSKVNYIRVQYHFGAYSPINSDSEDNGDEKEEKEDLAAGLLNSFDVSKVAPPPQNTSTQH